MALREKHRLQRLAGAVRSLVVDEARPAPVEDTPRSIGGLEEMVLHGMQHKPHVYQGTVDPVVVQERRDRNRRARKARRLNRNR